MNSFLVRSHLLRLLNSSYCLCILCSHLSPYLYSVLLSAGRWAPDAELLLQRSRARGPAKPSRRPSRGGGWRRRSGSTAPVSAWAGGRSTRLRRTSSGLRRTSGPSGGTKQWVGMSKTKRCGVEVWGVTLRWWDEKTWHSRVTMTLKNGTLNIKVSFFFFCCQCQANIKNYFLCMTESDQRVKILKNSDGAPRNFTVMCRLTKTRFREANVFFATSRYAGLMIGHAEVKLLVTLSISMWSTGRRSCVHLHTRTSQRWHWDKLVIKVRSPVIQPHNSVISHKNRNFWIKLGLTMYNYLYQSYFFDISVEQNWYYVQDIIESEEYCDEWFLPLRTMFRVSAPRVGRDSGPSYFSDLSPMGAETPDAGAARRSRKVVEYFWIPTDEEWVHEDLNIDVGWI